MTSMLTRTAAALSVFASISVPVVANAQIDVDGDVMSYQGFTAESYTAQNGAIGETPYGAAVAYTGGAAAVAIPGSNATQTGGQATLSSSGSTFTITDVTAFAPPACASGQSCFEGGFITIAGESITSVNLISSSLSGFTQADIGFAPDGQGDNGAFLNFQGQNVVPGDTFTFSVDATPVPLPAAGWLTLSSMGGLAWFARRRRVVVA